MDETDILIKAYDNRYNLAELNKLYRYLLDNKLNFTGSQLTYLCFALNTYGELAIKSDIKTINKTLEIMQYSNKDYDENLHERKKALTVKNPYAEWIAQGKKQIEVRSKNTTYRGELVICSSKAPEIQEMQSGCMLALVELYETKRLEDLTPEEWHLTCIPKEERKDLKGYGWFLRNPSRLVEYPVKGQLGIWNLVVDKMEFVPYNSEAIHNIDVEVDYSQVYNRQAVKDGYKVIIFIFVIVVAVVFGLLWLLLA